MTNYLFIWVPAGICLLITVLGFNLWAMACAMPLTPR